MRRIADIFWSRRAIRFVCGGMLLVGPLLFAVASRAVADDVLKGSDAAAKSAVEYVAAKRKSLAAEISALAGKNGDHSADADPADVSAAEDELEFLETLDAVYAQQQARVEQRQELQAEKKKAEGDLESLGQFGPSEATPYLFCC